MKVLEHIQDDVGALHNIAGVLGERGRVVAMVPQGPGLFGTLDEMLGHCRRYNPERVVAMGRAAGMKVLEVREMDRLGSLGWWLNGRLLRRRTLGLAQLKLLDTAVPLPRRVDHWLPLPALSLVAVFEKSAAASS